MTLSPVVESVGVSVATEDDDRVSVPRVVVVPPTVSLKVTVPADVGVTVALSVTSLPAATDVEPVDERRRGLGVLDRT